MKRIEDEPNPQVGAFYWVPCVDYFPHVSTVKPQRMPVIGPWHEDADIGVADYHFHYDLRFLNPEDFDVWYMARVHPSKCSVRGNPFAPNIIRAPIITHRRRKMLRVMPDMPKQEKTSQFPKWQKALETKFANHNVLQCRTCPHRGMSLDGLPVAPDGTVVCNGHGLKWSLLTGRLVPR